MIIVLIIITTTIATIIRKRSKEKKTKKKNNKNDNNNNNNNNTNNSNNSKKYSYNNSNNSSNSNNSGDSNSLSYSRGPTAAPVIRGRRSEEVSPEMMHNSEMACVAAQSDTLFTVRDSTQVFDPGGAQLSWTVSEYLEDFVVHSQRTLYLSVLADDKNR